MPRAQKNNETQSDQVPFADLADGPSPGVLRELVDLLKHNKKWWLAPLLLVLLLVGLIIVLGSSAAAPFIYTLF